MSGAGMLWIDRLPDGFTGLLLERNHRGLAARRADDIIAIHQGRFAVAPVVAFVAAKVVPHALAPALGALRGFEADEVASRCHHIEQFAVDGRRRAGAMPVRAALVPGGAGLREPELLAAGFIETGDVFVPIAGGGGSVAESVDLAVRDR